MRSLFLIVSFTLATAAFAGQEAGMPYALCIPAAKAAQSAFAKEPDQHEFLQGYRYGYVESLIGDLLDESYSTSLDTEQTPFAKGFRAAKQYAKQRSKNREALGLWLDSFGYKPVEVTGQLTLEFERSIFVPQGKTEPWWVRLSRGASLKFLEQSRDRKSRPVKIKGWLSPEGTYGHFGTGKHEIVITRMEEGE